MPVVRHQWVLIAQQMQVLYWWVVYQQGMALQEVAHAELLALHSIAL